MATIVAKNAKKRADREGENFVGLQTYIISEIDSGSDNNNKQPGPNGEESDEKDNFMSDASSFSNSESSVPSSFHRPHSQSGSDEGDQDDDEDSEEQQDVIFGAMQGLLPKNDMATKQALSKIWQQTPMIKE